MRHRDFLLASLALALIGFWMPWLTHPAAALRLNGYELSEWVTFLPGVRDGSLPFGRFSPLIPAAALVPLFGIAAARSRSQTTTRRHFRVLTLLPNSFFSWGLLLFALLCAATLFPPYEAFVRSDYWPEYQPQFLAVCVALVGLAVSLALPDEVNDILQILLALLGGGYAAWLTWTLWAVTAQLFHAGWSIGLGWAAMLAGFAGLALAGWAKLFGPR
ncbi:MAG: hypothetical protein HW378_2361 [Anaerolineales bacterium]|nr:hypothetical protein [Anaerolineales bacterium]